LLRVLVLLSRISVMSAPSGVPAGFSNFTYDRKDKDRPA
jgi:hypothetical protein